MRRLVLCLVAFSLLSFAAKNDRNWKTGKVADSTTTIGDSSGSAGALAASARPPHVQVDAHVVTIQGADTTYVVKEQHPWHTWCLLIVGDSVKFVEDKQNLIILDAGGKECKFVILPPAKRL